MSEVIRKVSRPERWDNPFNPKMDERSVGMLMSEPPFSLLDESRFPGSTPLRGILRNDCQLVHCRPGQVIYRQGDYGNSAYIVLSGSVKLVLDKLPPAILGHSEPKRKGLLEVLAQLWSNSRIPEVKRDKGNIVATEGEDTAHIFLQDMPQVIAGRQTNAVRAGQLFGELAALGRMPRSATAIADSETVLLEIRWQGLRDIRRWSSEFRREVDRVYRKNALREQLVATPLFQHLDGPALRRVMDHTALESYGNFDWHASFKTVAEAGVAQRLENEPVIVREGDYPNGLILVRSGFVRVSRRYGRGERTISYLGRGQVYGMQEIAHNWRAPQDRVVWQNSLRAVGYVDVLLIPTWIVVESILPTVPARDLPSLIQTRHQNHAADHAADHAANHAADGGVIPSRRPPQTPPSQEGSVAGQPVDPGMLEFLVDERFINGASAMVINMDRCTRCDDCVRACAETHDNNPRFLRHGPIVDGLMIANACMHCADPVCMIGCPTGAIHRSQLGGEVVINDATCIGCSICANSCPYDNIRMVQLRDQQGTVYLDLNTHNPLLKATKCDLCTKQWGGPACQRACPHDALFRIDLRSTDELPS